MADSPTEHTEVLLRIGEVTRLFNLSVGTLRHYEQMGLLDPAHIDPASGYRYYGSRQLSTLNTISHLRVLDLPLAQIREFVTTRDVDLMQRQLAQQQEDLVVAIKVAGGEALGANPDAQVAQKDKGLVLALLQLTNLPLQRIGVGRVDAFAQHGAAKLGRIDFADGIELGAQGIV